MLITTPQYSLALLNSPNYSLALLDILNNP